MKRSLPAGLLMMVMVFISIRAGAAAREEALQQLERLGIPVSEESLEKQVSLGNLRNVRLLLDAGMSPNSRCASDRYPILSYAALNGKEDIVRLLVERGADVNAEGPRSKMGGTPILFAVGGGNLNILRFLISKGADVNRPTVGNATPLMAAVTADNAAAVKMLLAAGADPLARTVKGDTALDIAKRKGQAEIARILEEAVRNRGGR